MAILFSSMACMMYVGWARPYKNEITNYLELFNETCIFFSTHVCLVIQATRGMYEEKYRNSIGWLFIIVFVVNVIINQALVISQLVYDWKNSPKVLKRRARFAKFYRMVSEWDVEQCSCACSSCSGTARMPMAIDRRPNKFELDLIPCEIDTTLMTVDQAAQNSKFKYSGDRS